MFYSKSIFGLATVFLLLNGCNSAQNSVKNVEKNNSPKEKKIAELLAKMTFWWHYRFMADLQIFISKLMNDAGHKVCCVAIICI